MPRSDFLSFVLPTRDRPIELERTLARLGALEPLVDAEVIVVDNHSRQPVSVPGGLANGWRALTLRRPRNEGAAARNDGVRIASGAWIVMLDDDSHPLDLGVVEAITEAPSDVAAIGAEITLPDGGHEQGGLPEVTVGCGVAIRRAAYVAAGGYDPAFHFYVEEYDLCARFLLGGLRVTHDPRFRVLHEKTPTNRDMGVVLGRLVRNNGWVLRRYAPEDAYRPALEETIARYESIARREDALEGYRRGYEEFLATEADQVRTPMDDALWRRFTGETAAREALLRQRGVIDGRRVALVAGGKAEPTVARIIRSLGGVLAPVDDAQTLVVGTLSPGPIADAARQYADDGRPVVLPWSFPCPPHPLRRAG